MLSILRLGPDAQQTYTTSLKADSNNDSTGSEGALVSMTESDRRMDLKFFASELRLRGDRPVVQPHEKDGDVLCWNGEVSCVSPQSLSS